IVGYENAILKDSSQIITIYSPLYKIYCGEFKVFAHSKITNFDGVTKDPEFSNMALWRIER
ncbi:MAG TPA: hypothetical protein VFO76_11205, partial [Candidatus Kapabacteria bacterium]|nr:hypothetical protein [Candidatus Kapabacteria bacterium]